MKCPGHLILLFLYLCIVFLSSPSLCQHQDDMAGKMQYIMDSFDMMETWMKQVDSWMAGSQTSYDWGPWSDCSQDCDGGQMTRYKRNCRPRHEVCVQNMYCNAKPCAKDGHSHTQAPHMDHQGKKGTKFATCHMRPNPNYSGPNSVKGVVRMKQTEHGNLEIQVDLSGFSEYPPGTNPEDLKHGFHVHEYGDLHNGCESVGSHFNPHGTSHGDRYDIIRHAGDLGNIKQALFGRVNEAITLKSSDTTLFGEHSIIGRAMVVHEDKDDLGQGGDHGSLIDGNAGPRIACCVIGISLEKDWMDHNMAP